MGTTSLPSRYGVPNLHSQRHTLQYPSPNGVGWGFMWRSPKPKTLQVTSTSFYWSWSVGHAKTISRELEDQVRLGQTLEISKVEQNKTRQDPKLGLKNTIGVVIKQKQNPSLLCLGVLSWTMDARRKSRASSMDLTRILYSMRTVAHACMRATCNQAHSAQKKTKR